MHLLDVDRDSFGRLLGNQGLEDLMADLREGIHARRVVAESNQREAARRLDGAVPIDEFEMYPEFVVDADGFMDWVIREGPDCWNDDTFIKEFRRDNPDCNVKLAPRPVSILAPGPSLQYQETPRLVLGSKYGPARTAA